MRDLIKKILKESDWDWSLNTSEYDYVLNKAFYFNPLAEDGDEDYEKLTELFESLGFEGRYNTPLKLRPGETSVGLYTYKHKNDGSLCYVFTTRLYEDEDYYIHIREFAEGVSEDLGQNIVVVDARDFVKNNL